MYQKLIVAGNLGGDPEMRYTPSGQAVTNFSVATNRRWTNTDGSQGEEVTWFRITAWGKLAEVCNQYLAKGRAVLIEGRLTPDKASGGPRVWTGNDGQARASFEVTAETVKFLGGPRGESNGESAPAPEMSADEIPF
jgi:single-strand DNA-binding protein